MDANLNIIDHRKQDDDHNHKADLFFFPLSNFLIRKVQNFVHVTRNWNFVSKKI